MADAFIALGSNLGNRLHHLIASVDLLRSTEKIISIAPLYESSAYGYTEQPMFLNSAIMLQTTAEPLVLLERLKEIEKQVGRKQRIRWGPREIDLDIVFYDQLIMRNDRLTIPHPDFQNRRFVLQPLTDMAPGFISPLHQKTLLQLLNVCTDTTKLILTSTEWYPHGLKI